MKKGKRKLWKKGDWVFCSDGRYTVGLDVYITPRLAEKGIVNEVIHFIQMERKRRRTKLQEKIRYQFDFNHKQLEKIVNRNFKQIANICKLHSISFVSSKKDKHQRKLLETVKNRLDLIQNGKSNFNRKIAN